MFILFIQSTSLFQIKRLIADSLVSFKQNLRTKIFYNKTWYIKVIYIILNKYGATNTSNHGAKRLKIQSKMKSTI